jgi:hypothetical protein
LGIRTRGRGCASSRGTTRGEQRTEERWGSRRAESRGGAGRGSEWSREARGAAVTTTRAIPDPGSQRHRDGISHISYMCVLCLVSDARCMMSSGCGYLVNVLYTPSSAKHSVPRALPLLLRAFSPQASSLQMATAATRQHSVLCALCVLCACSAARWRSLIGF